MIAVPNHDILCDLCALSYEDRFTGDDGRVLPDEIGTNIQLGVRPGDEGHTLRNVAAVDREPRTVTNTNVAVTSYEHSAHDRQSGVPQSK